MTRGCLYLIPAPISGAPWEDWLPPGVRAQALALDYFIAENARTARAALKSLGQDRPLRDILILELPRGSVPPDVLSELLDPLQEGRSAGLISEAGLPAIADPGAAVVRAAHLRDIRVMPLAGPSSLLLALAASGLCGQRFCFHGYLPVKPEHRAARLRELELDSRRHRRTHAFIETPYRNNAMLAAVLKHCGASTWLTVAADLTAPTQFIRSRPVGAWQREALEPLDRRPAVFLLAAD